MKKTLYYVIEKQLEDINGVEQVNGLKFVTTFSIEDNKLKQQFVIEIDNWDDSQQAIGAYLEDNGMGDDEFELVQL